MSVRMTEEVDRGRRDGGIVSARCRERDPAGRNPAPLLLYKSGIHLSVLTQRAVPRSLEGAHDVREKERNEME